MAWPEAGEAWKRLFPDVPPVGRMLRDDLLARWARIHSLPDSKRYPEELS